MTAAALEEINGIRIRINQVDERVIAYLAERGQLAQRVQKIRHATFDTPPGTRDQIREVELVRSIQRLNPGPYPAETIAELWEVLFCARLPLD